MSGSYCAYQFNASEVYQRTKPGMGVETSCGALTFPAIDEPELVPLVKPDGTVEYRPTGRYLPRAASDPYCPLHGGTDEPDEVPVSLAELQQARLVLTELERRFTGPAIEAAQAPLTALEAGPGPFETVAARADTSALTGGSDDR